MMPEDAKRPDQFWGQFWESLLVKRFFSRIHVQIIEALRALDEPLTPCQLSGLFDEEIPWGLLDYNLQVLEKRDIVEPMKARTRANARDVPYQLASRVTCP